MKVKDIFSGTDIQGIYNFRGYKKITYEEIIDCEVICQYEDERCECYLLEFQGYIAIMHRVIAGQGYSMTRWYVMASDHKELNSAIQDDIKNCKLMFYPGNNLETLKNKLVGQLI